MFVVWGVFGPVAPVKTFAGRDRGSDPRRRLPDRTLASGAAEDRDARPAVRPARHVAGVVLEDPVAVALPAVEDEAGGGVGGVPRGAPGEGGVAAARRAPAREARAADGPGAAHGERRLPESAEDGAGRHVLGEPVHPTGLVLEEARAVPVP